MEYSILISLLTGKKNCKKTHILFLKSPKEFLVSYFEYHQIWLNILMNDCHLNKITKLGGKKIKKL